MNGWFVVRLCSVSSSIEWGVPVWYIRCFFQGGQFFMTMISHPMSALPVRTLERVPAETVQVWVQFACSANNPGVFFVLADVFFALSWELRAHDSWQQIERIVQH